MFLHLLEYINEINERSFIAAITQDPMLFTMGFFNKSYLSSKDSYNIF
jgi:hypothetical protein